MIMVSYGPEQLKKGFTQRLNEGNGRDLCCDAHMKNQIQILYIENPNSYGSVLGR